MNLNIETCAVSSFCMIGTYIICSRDDSYLVEAKGSAIRKRHRDRWAVAIYARLTERHICLANPIRLGADKKVTKVGFEPTNNGGLGILKPSQ